MWRAPARRCTRRPQPTFPCEDWRCRGSSWEVRGEREGGRREGGGREGGGEREERERVSERGGGRERGRGIVPGAAETDKARGVEVKREGNMGCGRVIGMETVMK